MITYEKALALRRLIEKAATSLSDEDALDGKELFPHWELGISYAMDTTENRVRVMYNGKLYKCLQAHTSIEASYNPEDAVSLWAEVLIPDPEVIYDWVQPESTNPYMMGDKVRHNGKIWVSTMDYNVFEPGVAGWNEVTE